jgi:hypothetical protein
MRVSSICSANFLSLRMTNNHESKSYGKEVLSAAASAALIAGCLFTPFPSNAGNNYPPIDTKDPNRCEVRVMRNVLKRMNE